MKLKNIFENYKFLIFLVILDKIITIVSIEMFGLSIEFNPLMRLYYPYTFLIIGASFCFLVYLLKNIKIAIKFGNIIFLATVLFNSFQLIDIFFNFMIYSNISTIINF